MASKVSCLGQVSPSVIENDPKQSAEQQTVTWRIVWFTPSIHGVSPAGTERHLGWFCPPGLWPCRDAEVFHCNDLAQALTGSKCHL